MIIDCHGHVSAPAELWVYKANLLSHLGAHGRRMPEVSDAQIIEAMNRKEMGRVAMSKHWTVSVPTCKCSRPAPSR